MFPTVSLRTGRLSWTRSEGRMYIPAHFSPDEALVDELLRNHGAADLVTVTPQGLVATMLPFVWVPSAASTGRCTGTWPGTTTSGSWTPWARRSRSCGGRGTRTSRPGSTLEAGERSGGADLELRHRARVRGAGGARRPGVGRGPGAAADRQARGLPGASVVGRRRAPGVHRGAAAGDRRGGAGGQPDRGEGQAQPEPVGRGRRGRDRRAARARRQGGGRRGGGGANGTRPGLRADAVS